MTWKRGAVVGAMLLMTSGCAGQVGQFVWIDAYGERPGAAPTGYVIARGDLLQVRVWNQEAISGRSRVRPDGKISLPLLNDVDAAGLQPPALAERLQTQLKEFVVNPVVTVSVEEQAPLEVSVVGEVTRPGVYKIEGDATVLKALAQAGGLTQLAGRDRIFVLRYGEGADAKVPTRIRFTYRALTQAEGSAASFRLRRGDAVVVE